LEARKEVNVTLEEMLAKRVRVKEELKKGPKRVATLDSR